MKKCQAFSYQQAAVSVLLEQEQLHLLESIDRPTSGVVRSLVSRLKTALLWTTRIDRSSLQSSRRAPLRWINLALTSQLKSKCSALLIFYINVRRRKSPTLMIIKAVSAQSNLL